MYAALQHFAAVGTGFIPVLPTADKIQSNYPAAARVGINHTPTVDVCCNNVENPLIAKVLHSAAVGTGFIPVLPAADKIQSNYTAAARVGINPTPTVDVCCIAAPCRRRDRVYPCPTSNEQDIKQLPRSCKDGDKPHPYIG